MGRKEESIWKEACQERDRRPGRMRVREGPQDWKPRIVDDLGRIAAGGGVAGARLQGSGSGERGAGGEGKPDAPGRCHPESSGSYGGRLGGNTWKCLEEGERDERPAHHCGL